MRPARMRYGVKLHEIFYRRGMAIRGVVSALFNPKPSAMVRITADPAVADGSGLTSAERGDVRSRRPLPNNSNLPAQKLMDSRWARLHNCPAEASLPHFSS